MGIYNTYGKVQMKIGDLTMKDYKINDKVDIPDGIYVGYGGVIVIKDGIFAMEVDTLIDKWGQPLTCEKVLRGRGLLDITEKTVVTTKEERPEPEIVSPVETAPKVEEKETVVPEITPKVEEKEKTIPETPKKE